jgi:hypothetical protein
VIDYLLNFKKQVNNMVKIIAYKIAFLQRYDRLISKMARMLVYNAIVKPHFDYCASILMCCNRNDMRRLQRLQIRAVRTIIGDRRGNMSNKEMLEELGELSVEQQIMYKVFTYIHDIEKGKKDDTYQHLKKNEDIHSYDTRNKEDFHMMTQNKKCGQKSILVNGLKEYNKIPREIRNCQKKETFQQHVKEYVKNQYELVAV